MRVSFFLLFCVVAIEAVAEKQPFDRYQSIIDRHMFGEPPPDFDPEKMPSEVAKSSRASGKELTQEQGETISAETPGGNTDGSSDDVNSVKKSSSNLPFILGAIAVIALALMIITVVIVKELNKKEDLQLEGLIAASIQLKDTQVDTSTPGAQLGNQISSPWSSSNWEN